MTEKKTIIDTFCGSLRIEQQREDGHVKLQTRRVETSDRGEHVQMEVEVAVYHKTRTETKHASVALDPASVSLLVTALTKLHPPFTEADRHRTFADERKLWCEFYGLPAEKVEYGIKTARFPA